MAPSNHRDRDRVALATERARDFGELGLHAFGEHHADHAYDPPATDANAAIEGGEGQEIAAKGSGVGVACHLLAHRAKRRAHEIRSGRPTTVHSRLVDACRRGTSSMLSAPYPIRESSRIVGLSTARRSEIHG